MTKHSNYSSCIREIGDEIENSKRVMKRTLSTVSQIMIMIRQTQTQ